MKVLYKQWIVLASLLCIVAQAFAENWIFNNPYPDSESTQKIYYSSFIEQPKTLDPARSYSSNEYQFIMQIYEPLLHYDYFIRPYKLVPLVASLMPEVHYFDRLGHELTNKDKDAVAYSKYIIHIKPGILFQPHPAFAKDNEGNYRYLNLLPNYLDDQDINKLADFKHTGTRELTVDDYIYQIKRLARPAVNSPIYGLMSEHIVGFREFAQLLPAVSPTNEFVDLRKYTMAGLHKLDNYSFEILIYKQYSQFIFWLAMPFFAPIPWEADQFYAQEGMKDKNLTFEWYPVGTGAFLLSVNNPNRRMVLSKNPNFREEYFPINNSKNPDDQMYIPQGVNRLPLINKAVYTLEKESIPRWNKFLQGYYDSSGVSADSFDQVIQISANGEPSLIKSMVAKKMNLTKTTDTSIYYIGFNMLDNIVGGNSERARKLRLAISIAVNFNEYIAIFFNGRGKAAQGPISPGIFGFKKNSSGINPYIFEWDGNKPVRKSLNIAKALMKEAGYPGGLDPKTGQALILHYDVPVTAAPDDKARLDWMRKQFARIGIDLNIRATQYNRFQDKMRSGNAQVFSWAWNADYPDPENFLFMFYGANGRVKNGGENASNYKNPIYDQLFDRMKNRENDDERQRLIDEMVEILRHDAPWVWGVNSQTLLLSQQWVSPIKPNTIDLNSLKYRRVDVELRNKLRHQWNYPVLWPIGILLLLIVLFTLPLLLSYYWREQQLAKRINS